MAHLNSRTRHKNVQVFKPKYYFISMKLYEDVPNNELLINIYLASFTELTICLTKTPKKYKLRQFPHKMCKLLTTRIHKK
jgi:hypothetical protein